MTARILAVGTLICQRYQVQAAIGSGGMGMVYRALDTQLGVSVAVKQMLDLPTEAAIKAFEREARILKSLEHPFLPKVHDFIKDADDYFLIMEFVDGLSLDALLARQGGALDWHDVLLYADRLLEVLEYLHTRQPPVLHRDIKPQNIKITSNNTLMLLDFGLAKDGDGTGSQRSMRAYTRQYASYEQINGLEVDQRSDVYAAAATIYHLLTGSPPSEAAFRDDNVRKTGFDSLAPAHRRNPHVPETVSAALRPALEIHRERRLPSATALRHNLQTAAPKLFANQAAAAELPLPKRQNWQRRAGDSFRRWLRRVVEIAGTSLLVLLVLVGALALVTSVARVSLRQLTPGMLWPSLGIVLLVGLALAVPLALLYWRLPQPVGYRLGVHNAPVTDVAFSPNGRLLVSASADYSIRLWDTGRERQIGPAGYHAREVRRVGFAPNGQTFVSASADGVIQVWKARDGSQLYRVHGQAPVSSMCFSHDSQLLITGHDEGTIRHWRVKDGAALRSPPAHRGQVTCLALAPDNSWMASGGEDGIIQLWRADELTPYATLTGHTGLVSDLAISPDGRLLASAAGDATVRLWRVATGDVLRTLRGHTFSVTSVMFDPTGKLLASCSQDTNIIVWRVRDGSRRRVLRGHSSYICGLTFSRDGRAIISASWDATLRVWGTHDGQVARPVRGHLAAIKRLASSPDGRWLATGGLDGAVVLWRVKG